MRSTTAIDRLPLHYENPEQTAELFGLDRTLKQQIFGISPRNLARLKRANGVLHPLVVARLKRFDRITQQAIDLFEDRQRAISWLQARLLTLYPLACQSSCRKYVGRFGWKTAVSDVFQPKKTAPIIFWKIAQKPTKSTA